MKKRKMRILACLLSCQMVMNMPSVAMASNTVNAAPTATEQTAGERTDDMPEQAGADSNIESEKEETSETTGVSEEVTESTNTSDESGSGEELDYILGRPMTEEEIAEQKALEPDNLVQRDSGTPVIEGSSSGLYRSMGDLPASYSLADQGMVTSVKNQNPAGMCWAFSSLSSGESSLLMKGKKAYDLSEAQLGCFTYGDVVPQGCEGDYMQAVQNNWYNIGGNDMMTTFSLARWTGAVDESKTGFPGSAVTYPNELAYSQNTAVLKNADWMVISDSNTVKSYIKDKGAVSASFYYDTNDYNSSTAAYYMNVESGVNHAITIVGWNDNYSRNNFNTDPGVEGAWLCKNSWGTNWGDFGYFWISYGDANLIGQDAYGYEMIPVEESYEHNYQYDGGGSSTSISYGTNYCYESNIFKTQGKEALRAVSVATIQTNTNYEIQIYGNVGTTPTSGTPLLAEPITGTLTYAGYHTIEVPAGVTLSAGEKFSVVVKLQCAAATDAVRIMVDSETNYGWVYMHASSQSGQSFISSNGTYWEDNTSGYYPGNVRIKAFTDDYNGKTDIATLAADSIADAVYCASAVTPGVTLRDGSYTLVAGVDYNLEYDDNINAGEAVVTITGIGNYTGTKIVNFIINPLNLENITQTLKFPDTIYSGESKEPSIDSYGCLTSEDYDLAYVDNIDAGQATITMTGKGINAIGEKIFHFNILPAEISSVEGVVDKAFTGSALTQNITVKASSMTLTTADYTVTYKNNTNPGTAELTVTGKDNYKGTITKTFEITNTDLSAAVISNIAPIVYTGEEITPAVTVSFGGKTLVKDTDYTVTYLDNVEAGTARVFIEGMGTYLGSQEKTFTISPKDIISMSASAEDVTYSGRAQETSITCDFTYDAVYANNTNVGTATVTLTGTGNYRGTKVLTFKINKKDMDSLNFNVAFSAKTYTGQPIELPLDTYGDLTKGKDYTVSYRNNTNIGQATAILTGMGNYIGTREILFTISPASISTVDGVVDKIYTGNAIEQELTVFCEDRELTEETDYTVTYKNNIEVGKATVTVTGKGNYTGTISHSFNIVDSDFTKVTVTGIANKNYTGSALTQNVVVKSGLQTLVAGVDYTVSYKNNVTPGTATITLAGTGKYTGTITRTFNINLAAKGWKKVSGYWYYAKEANSLVRKAWVKSSGKWYWMEADGKMATNAFVSSNNYHVDGSGVMQIGWFNADGARYYADAAGFLYRTKWFKYSGAWYYFESDKKMATGWTKVGGKWYYMNSSGIMKTGWVKVGSKWYYMNGSGIMQTGWVKAGSKWYYMNSSGIMQTGWVKVGGKWYYLYSSGVMAANTWVGNYWLNSSGVWTKSR